MTEIRPRNDVVRAGVPARQLPESAMTIRGQQLAVLRDQIGEMVRTDLLLAFDDHLDPHRRSSPEGPDCAGVGDDPRLVVGGAPPVEAPVPLHGLERLTVPSVVFARGLDVVVGIEQDRRRARWSGDRTEHRRVGAVEFEEADVVHAGFAEEVGGGFGGASHLRRIEPVGAHRGDADQALEVGLDAGKEITDGLAQVFVHDGDDSQPGSAGDPPLDRRRSGEGRVASSPTAGVLDQVAGVGKGEVARDRVPRSHLAE